MKQETLEEETLSRIKFVLLANNDAQAIRVLEQYAEFQKEQMYTEEDMKKAFEWGIAHITFEEWLEQFKKK